MGYGVWYAAKTICRTGGGFMKRQVKARLLETAALMFTVQNIVLCLASCGLPAYAACIPGQMQPIYAPAEQTPEQVLAATESDAAESDDIVSDAISVASAPEAERIMKASASTAMSLSAPRLVNSPVGDLWQGWDGTVDFSGDGTQEYPYQIDSLPELMGLSAAVAAGETFEGKYFELTQDIDLGNVNVNYGNWNPIGWYQDASDLSGDVDHAFQGNFDGCGNTISGLKITDPSKKLKNIGLFGVIDGGTVKNLTVEADDICGEDNAAVLVGAVKGHAVIADITVSGLVQSAEDAGGIVGEVRGGTEPAVIENCLADGIVVYSSGSNGYVGGIAGNLQNAYLVDSTAITQDGDYNRIYGKGYVGGIAGRMNRAQIYNVYVNGTIGGNGSRAVGGIVGKYESGNLILARMAGDISRTNQGSAAREGTFVGTRESRDHFTFGTERTSNLAYLYANSAAKARKVSGSTIDGDNTYTKDAHIGYWTDLEKKYVTLAGKIEISCDDRYFYEELEDGVRYLVTQKLNREFTAQGYGEGLDFRLDHFAPGYMGEPIRGYLVSISRIDALNDNGTLDTDVAVLSAIPAINSYYRSIDKDHTAAVAPGMVVRVLTAPNDRGDDRYQMVVDETETGGVIPPVYLDEQGDSVPMQYMNGGFYTFVMPECDTELNVEYVKVTTHVSIEPEETTISITHTRSGDRRYPYVVTEVKNEDGILIARYIGSEPDHQVEVQPVTIHAFCNGNGATADQSVKWSVDDADLLINSSESGYTKTAGRIMPNLNSSFIQGILNQEIQAQADNGYRNKVNDTIYTRSAVITASTNPDTSVDHQTVCGNCRVNVTFQILDHTTVRVDGMSLNRSNLTYTITRRLTGNRLKPIESYEVTAPVILTVTLNPEQPFYKNVSWADRESGKIIHLTPSGDHTQDCMVTVNYDVNGKEHPAWIRNLIQADQEKLQQDPYARQESSGTYTEIVTAASEDQTNGHITAACEVLIQFVTKDETVLRGSGSGGSSGGGAGGGSSGGSGVTGTGVSGPGSGTVGIPDYVVTGTWTQLDGGNWMFADTERSYVNEWAAVRNPYADLSAGQEAYDWFRFGDDGFLVTGWFTDYDDKRYYLNPFSDGTRGRMVTGWHWIDGFCYYFQELSDGFKGALLVNTVTPDGYTVGETGAWIVDGVVQRQQGQGLKSYSCLIEK